LYEYQDVIANDKDLPGHTDLITHSIVTDNTLPIKQRPYRLSPTEHDFVMKELDQILEQGIIQPFQSLWASPIVLVKKKNGKMKFCINY